MKDEVAASRVQIEATADGARGTFRFAPVLSVFAGHFPWHPLVPSVMLIEAVRQTVDGATGRAWFVAEVAQAKFTAQVGPGDTITCAVATRADGDALHATATITRDDVVAAKVTLRLTPA